MRSDDLIHINRHRRIWRKTLMIALREAFVFLSHVGDRFEK